MPLISVHTTARMARTKDFPPAATGGLPASSPWGSDHSQAECIMPAGNLREIYIDEMRDLWSANEQMQQFMKSLSAKTSDKKLKDLLEQSVTGIGRHTETLKSVLEAAGGSVGKEHCKGMEGLIAEAKKHALADKLDPAMRDLMIIAQYQRMSHYGLAGFGTAASYATALGDKDGAAKLKSIVKDIYKADEYTSQMAEHSEKAAARAGWRGLTGSRVATFLPKASVPIKRPLSRFRGGRGDAAVLGRVAAGEGNSGHARKPGVTLEGADPEQPEHPFAALCRLRPLNWRRLVTERGFRVIFNGRSVVSFTDSRLGNMMIEGFIGAHPLSEDLRAALLGVPMN
jgi:ferritin-like metal-binding protein YciE